MSGSRSALASWPRLRSAVKRGLDRVVGHGTFQFRHSPKRRCVRDEDCHCHWIELRSGQGKDLGMRGVAFCLPVPDK